MSLRKLEVLLSQDQKEEFQERLEGEGACAHIRFWTHVADDDRWQGNLLVQSEDSEEALDFLSEHFSQDGEPPAILVLPVEAALPRPQDEDEEEQEGESEKEKRTVSRISREELYSDLEQTSRLNLTYLVLVALASIVAGIGLLRGDVAVVVGAMVIAPLLGPNVALALAFALGDLQFARRSLLVGGAGLALALLLALGMGLVAGVDPSSAEIAPRTRAHPMDIVLALTAGTAGALSFTVGIPAAIVGVMVAVALLPPLVAFGMLAGSGNFQPALGAMLLTLTNLICVNLAGIGTFLAQGIRPNTWGEQDKARRATRIAIGCWLGLLAILAVIMFWLQPVEPVQ